MSDVRLGLAGAGIRRFDRQKASEGVLTTVEAGRFKGLRVRIRHGAKDNPLHRQFLDDWAEGRFREMRNGQKEETDEDSKLAPFRATQSPEYIAHVLVADLPDGVAIPEKVDDLETLPEAIHDHYLPDESGEGWRRKKNRKDWVEYTPEIGVWLFGDEGYPQLRDVAWVLAAREEQFLEEREDKEGNG